MKKVLFRNPLNRDTSTVSRNDVTSKRSSSSISILKLAKQKQFDKIEEYLSDSNEARISEWIEDGSFPNAVSMGLEAFRGETILHLIMTYQPTVEVVDLLIRAMMKKEPHVIPEAVMDIQGRTPLTTAVIHNCDVSVVKRLLSGTTTDVPAVSQDSWQRLPLHWACNHSSNILNPRWSLACTFREQTSNNVIEVIEALLDVYPHAAVVKDVSGMTPLDLAKRNCSDPYLLQILGNAWECHKPKEDISNASTESTSTSDVPIDEFNTEMFYLDFDDMSSIGNGGVSRHCRRSTKLQKIRKRVPDDWFPHESFDI